MAALFVRIAISVLKLSNNFRKRGLYAQKPEEEEQEAIALSCQIMAVVQMALAVIHCALYIVGMATHNRLWLDLALFIFTLISFPLAAGQMYATLHRYDPESVIVSKVYQGYFIIKIIILLAVYIYDLCTIEEYHSAAAIVYIVVQTIVLALNFVVQVFNVLLIIRLIHFMEKNVAQRMKQEAAEVGEVGEATEKTPLVGSGGVAGGSGATERSAAERLEPAARDEEAPS